MNTAPLHDDSDGRPDRSGHGPASLLSNPYALIAVVFGMVGVGMMIGGNNAGLPFLVIALSFLVISFDGSAEETDPQHRPDAHS